MNKKLLFIALIVGIKLSAQCNPVNLPYTEDFESVTTPALPPCTTIENAGLGSNWITKQNAHTGISSKALTYKFNSSNAANAWFFTPGLNLIGGVQYKITYKYSGTGGTFPEKLKVAYGMGANSSSMTNQLADYPNIVTSSVSTDAITFTPSTTGVYYMGFNCYSNADQYYLQVDDISVTNSQLATAEVNRKNDAVKIYPNPFIDVVNMVKADYVKSISINDMSGKTVKTIDKPSPQVSLKELIPGAYMIKLEMKDGSQKVIKGVKK
ncbi:T9SS-dependent choice-of-anchor J family protein [Chryseobacterium sp. PMSZPI]|uniref:T9SS-dependent choice-of-anchor J family protein n=1 Tax=Chryseobacterium sp. PMSZPI TaxID=1033900 RepID=UPI00105530A6|nr:choice-of-anchor J domain-containing protein [Chryseobacterium sp. PMSZPI]